MGHFFTEGNIESVESAHKDGKEIGMEVTDFDYLQTSANQVSLDLNADFTTDIRTDISFAEVHLNLVQEEGWRNNRCTRCGFPIWYHG